MHLDVFYWSSLLENVCLLPACLKDTLVRDQLLGSHFLSLSTFHLALLFSLFYTLCANLCFYFVHYMVVSSTGAFIPVVFLFLPFLA